MGGGDAPGAGAGSSPGGAGLDAAVLAATLKALGNPRRVQLLGLLVRPRTFEDVAGQLGIARQNAQEHVQQLVDLGVVQRLQPPRGGAATFVVVPQKLFAIQEEFSKLGTLQPEVAPAGWPPTSPLAPTAAGPRERDLPRLTIVRGMRLGETRALSGPGPWLVGREPAAAVSLDYDPFVSVRHAEVRRVPAGGFEVADLYSSNGTSLDWERLPRGGSRALANGALVAVGRTFLLFRTPA